jgi:hypothetical protein
MKEWNENIAIKKNQLNRFNKRILERALKHRGIDCNQDWLNSLGLPTRNNRDVGYKNHKVVEVVKLDYREDTGCITVEGHHNFAIKKGIVIKNSSLEDFYIPYREGSQQTRIETLPGGVQLNEIKDVEYFKDKLLRLLNIPMTYIGGSGDQQKDDQSRALSNLDIKFANYIEEIQSYITKGLNKIMALQLILKKYKNEDIINFKLELTPPSNLAELLKLDFLNQQAAVAASFKGLQLFSDEWIYKRIFNLSTKEIYQEQVKLAAQLQKMAAQGMAAMPGGEQAIAPPPGVGGEVQPPPPEGGTVPETPAAPQLASFNPRIYKLGLDALYENYEEIVVSDLADKFGNGYLTENRDEILEFINEVKKLKTIVAKEKKRKKKVKNNFQSMVRLGEFSGLNMKEKTMLYYREGQEKKINLIDEEEFNGD